MGNGKNTTSHFIKYKRPHVLDFLKFVVLFSKLQFYQLVHPEFCLENKVTLCIERKSSPRISVLTTGGGGLLPNMGLSSGYIAPCQFCFILYEQHRMEIQIVCNVTCNFYLLKNFAVVIYPLT